MVDMLKSILQHHVVAHLWRWSKQLVGRGLVLVIVLLLELISKVTVTYKSSHLH
jgi:hypothetical protein